MCRMLQAARKREAEYNRWVPESKSEAERARAERAEAERQHPLIYERPLRGMLAWMEGEGGLRVAARVAEGA